MDLSEDEVVDRIRSLPLEKGETDGPTLAESDRTIHSVVDTGGETDYARIYLVFVTGEYNGNAMLWQRYVWLSKPGAFESDMWGSNGMSMRLVDGMEDALVKASIAACNGHKSEKPRDEPRFVSAPEEAEDGDT